MDISQLGIFQLISGRLDWLSHRQEVLARNIANADTPGYRPSDLEPFAAVLAKAAPLTLAATRPGHLQPRGIGASPARERSEGDVYEVSPSGNAVVIEQQMMKVAETATQHELALQLYAKHLGMLRLALGRGVR
jgi:flagellar basal-body rod protein FlgB